MSAEVITPPGPYRYQAWCPTCWDGLNTNARGTANEWADDHNQRKHKEANAT